MSTQTPHHLVSLRHPQCSGGCAPAHELVPQLHVAQLVLDRRRQRGAQAMVQASEAHSMSESGAWQPLQPKLQRFFSSPPAAPPPQLQQGATAAGALMPVHSAWAQQAAALTAALRWH